MIDKMEEIRTKLDTVLIKRITNYVELGYNKTQILNMIECDEEKYEKLIEIVEKKMKEEESVMESGTKYKIRSDEEKLKIMNYAKENSRIAAMKKYGISSSLLYKWTKKSGKIPGKLTSSKTKKSPGTKARHEHNSNSELITAIENRQKELQSMLDQLEDIKDKLKLL